MIFKFGLIRVLESVETKLYLSGSVEELGAWDPDRAVLLHRISDGPVEEPAFWCTEVDIPSPKSFSYKFLLRFADGRLQWEGSGEEDNRRFDGSVLDDGRETHYMPPAYWIGSRVLGIHEAELLKFFGRLVTDKGIHFSKLDNNVWVGSCPRQFYHVAVLKSLGVDVVFCLQTENDIFEHSRLALPAGPSDRNVVLDLMTQYQHNGIEFVWMPIQDLSSAHRRILLPQALYLLQSLVSNRHRVYVHCNAGIGRAASLAVAYLIHAKRMSTREAEYTLLSKRPVVYIDEDSLTGKIRQPCQITSNARLFVLIVVAVAAAAAAVVVVVDDVDVLDFVQIFSTAGWRGSKFFQTFWTVAFTLRRG
ncbi:Laforin [Trichinella sp. T8]|nr:Laforin [Trichinella sp. T8]